MTLLHDFLVIINLSWIKAGATYRWVNANLISFARALVAGTRILVLDEATANVDSYSERKIQQALKVLLEGRTAIVIAHRLATIRDCDRILVLNHGRLVEEGSHQALMELDGLYARLCRLNYASFDDVPSSAIQE